MPDKVTMPDKALDAYTDFAQEMADVARHNVRQAASGPRRPTAKADASPVTQTDRAIECALREQIAARFPAHGVLGEEFGAENLNAEFVWVIDPIDGTKAFVGGLAVYGTLIALTRAGVPVLGLIDNPVTGERWLGRDGCATTRNGVTVNTAASASLAAAFIANGNPDALNADEKAGFERLRQATQWCIYGGSCMAYGRVADGSLDISVDGGLEPFDYCALVPVITGAGGCISDWQGRALTLDSGSGCVLASANAGLHAQALAVLN